MPTNSPRPSLNPDQDLYWQHNSHWSIRGEHLVGLLVSRYILEHHLVQVPDREARLRRLKRNWQISVAEHEVVQEAQSVSPGLT